MASIADLFGKLLLDDSGFEAAVVKSAGSAADKASQTMGQRVSSGLGKAFKVAGPAIGAIGGAAFGAAIEGAGQLTEAVAKYRAETGATEEEARAAQATISGLYKNNINGFEELGAVLTRVHNDLGLTGDAAEAAAQKVLDFAKVTGQDAVGAVGTLDDLTDTYNLNAAQQADILDKLVVSHQKYGGSVEKNQQSLVDLAPALTAANLSYDDGIGLLNLFEKAGVDAAAAPVALTKALTKVKSPEELKALIADIQATKDPFARATKAADLFGTRAGTKLALALGSGTDGFDEFAISATDAAGAVEKASDVLDASPLNQFKLALKKVGGALADVGTNFGPLLLGFSQLGGKGLVTKATAVIGGFIGKLSTGPLLKFAKGLSALGPAISDGLANAVSGVTSSSKFIGATDKLGSFMGSRLGKGLSVAFAAVMVFEVVQTYRRINDELNAQLAEIGADAAKQIISGTTEELKIGRDATAKGLQDIYNLGAAGVLLYGDQITTLKAQLADYNAAIDRSVSQTESSAAAAAAGVPAAVSSALEYGTSEVTQAAQMMTSGIAGELDGAAAEAGAAGSDITTSLAAGILAKQDAIGSAMDELTNQIKNQEGRQKRIARYIGFLTGDELIGGLDSKRAGVRDAAERTQQTVAAELQRLIEGGGKVGRDAQDALKAAMKSKNKDVRDAAKAVKAIIEKNIKPKTKPIGKTAVTDIRDQLVTGQGPVGTAAYNLGRTIAQSLLAGMPIQVGGRTSKSLTPHKAHGGPVTAGRPYIVGEFRPELFVPNVSGRIIPNLDTVAAAGSGGDTYNIPVHITGVLSARTPDDVARPLRALASSGLISAPRHRQLVKVPNA